MYILLLHKLHYGVELWTETGQVAERMAFLFQLWGFAAGEKEWGQHGILACTPLSCTIWGNNFVMRFDISLKRENTKTLAFQINGPARQLTPFAKDSQWVDLEFHCQPITHSGALSKVWDHNPAGPPQHTRSRYVCWKGRRREGNEMPTSYWGRMGNITTIQFNINHMLSAVYNFWTLLQPAPHSSFSPGQVLAVVPHIEWSKILCSDAKGLEQQVAKHPKVPRWI